MSEAIGAEGAAIAETERVYQGQIARVAGI